MVGKATAHDPDARTIAFESEAGDRRTLVYDHLVAAPGSVSRTLPIPGLNASAVGFKTVAEAIHLRNHAIKQLDLCGQHRGPRRAGGAPHLRVRGRRIRRRRGAGRSRGHAARGTAPVPVAGGRPAAVRAGGGHRDDLPRGGCAPLLLRHARTGAARGRDAPRHHRHRRHRRRGDAVERRAHRVPHARVDRRGAQPSHHGDAGAAHRPRGGRSWMPLWPWPTANTTGRSGLRRVPDPARIGLPCPPTASTRCVRQDEARTSTRHHGTNEPVRLPHPLISWTSAGARPSPRPSPAVPRLPAWFLARTYHLGQIPGMARKARVAIDWTVAALFRRDVAELGTLGHHAPLDTPSDT